MSDEVILNSLVVESLEDFESQSQIIVEANAQVKEDARNKPLANGRPLPTFMKSAKARAKPGVSIADIHDLTREISIIGLRFVVHSSSPLWSRLAWAALLLAGTAFTIYQIQDRVSYFISMPINVGIKVKRVDAMRFPTVTICNENRLQKSVVEELDATTLVQGLFSPVYGEDFTPSSFDATGYDTADNPDWSIPYRKMGQPLAQAIYAGARFDKTQISSSHFTVIPTDMGYCFTFNAGESNYTSVQAGAVSGLIVWLNAHQEEYFVANSAAAGFRVFLHDKNDVPQMGKNGFRVSVGFATQVAVTAEYVNDLPAPYGTCNDSLNYTQSVCEANCLADYVIKKCACKDIYMTGNASICGPRSLSICLYPENDYFTAHNLISSCPCPNKCSKLTYNYAISQAAISYLTMKWLNSTRPSQSMDTFVANYASLEVFFSDLQYKYIEATPAYTTLALLCDIGGALGLILGSSLLTFFELIDAVSTLLMRHYTQRKNRVTVKTA